MWKQQQRSRESHGSHPPACSDTPRAEPLIAACKFRSRPGAYARNAWEDHRQAKDACNPRIAARRRRRPTSAASSLPPALCSEPSHQATGVGHAQDRRPKGLSRWPDAGRQAGSSSSIPRVLTCRPGRLCVRGGGGQAQAVLGCSAARSGPVPDRCRNRHGTLDGGLKRARQPWLQQAAALCEGRWRRGAQQGRRRLPQKGCAPHGQLKPRLQAPYSRHATWEP